MSQFKNTSWGRTRSPKSLSGTQGGAVTASSAASLLGITATTTGYATENQRYLHVLTEDAHGAVPGTVKVYGYIHAFQRWFELPQSFSQVGANAAPTAVTIPAPADKRPRRRCRHHACRKRVQDIRDTWNRPRRLCRISCGGY